MSKKIMLDAGHYTNYNRSKVYKEYCEGNMVWELCKYLKVELEKYGFKVDTTRTSRDKDLALYNRGIKAKGYDMFISLHSNACDDEKIDRVVIIKGHDQPSTLADKFGNALTQVMGVKQKHQVYVRTLESGGEYYGVLRGAKAAGVANRFIIEHGFHTNTNTAKWLCVDANIKKLAEVEAKVIADHYGVKATVESKPAASGTESVNQLYRIIVDELNVRKGAGVSYDIVGVLKKGEVYTIVEKSNGWGKLKSGLGWINISEKYVEKK